MPLKEINISSNSSIEFDKVSLSQILKLYNVDIKSYISDVLVSTSSKVNFPLTGLEELKKLIEDKLFSKDFGNLYIESESSFFISVEIVKTIIEETFSNKKVNYIKSINLVSVDNKEITFKIITKIGLKIPLTIEFPISLDRFFILNFKLKNGANVFLKLINSIVKLSSDKTIIYKNNTIRLDLREIVSFPKSLLYIVDNWLSNLKGNLYFQDDFIKFDLSFKLDKTPHEELHL